MKGISIVGRKKKESETNKDLYCTPEWSTKALLKRELFFGSISEPCSGNGAISKVLEDFYPGKKIISSDISESKLVYGKKGKDIFDYEGIIANNVITNPPYGRDITKFVEKLLTLADRKVALLLRSTFLEGGKRNEFFKNTPLKKVYVFSNRVQMYPFGYKKPKNKGVVSYAWFVWDYKYKGTPRLYWINDKEEKK
jgi:hypothetical protein